MSACTLCCPWNFPLSRKATFVLDAGLVGMKFDEWIVYHLHVVLHQAGKYGGELEEITIHHEAPQQQEVITHA